MSLRQVYKKEIVINKDINLGAITVKTVSDMMADLNNTLIEADWNRAIEKLPTNEELERVAKRLTKGMRRKEFNVLLKEVAPNRKWRYSKDKTGFAAIYRGVTNELKIVWEKKENNDMVKSWEIIEGILTIIDIRDLEE